MHKFAASLPDDYEYAILWWGQSNATPQGTQTEGFAELPELELRDAGTDVTANLPGTAASGFHVVAVAETLTDSYWVGAELRVGRPGTPGVGYGTVYANTTGLLTVKWDVLPTASGSTDAYLNFRDGRHSQYPQVRVMTPFMPPWPPLATDTLGQYPDYTPVAPGVTFASDIDDFEKAAVFLPFTFREGINGWGYYEGDAAASAASATSLSLASSIMTADEMVGGWIIVYHALGFSWAQITDNDGSSFTVEAWSGVAYSASWGAAATWTWTAWVPHYEDNPHALSPHEGFLYPSNQMSSTPTIGGDLCRPRDRTARQWSATSFGAMLPTAWLLAGKLGRRINVIHLGFPATGILSTSTFFWPYFDKGWTNDELRLDWNPANTDNLFARLQLMIENAAAANAADGNTKPLRILAVFGFQGETEAAIETGREEYRRLLPAFYNRLREVVFDAGLSPYASVDELPIIHASLPSTPWEAAGADEDGLVNAAIGDYTAKIKFGATFDTNDSEKKSGDTQHFSGAGEVQNAKLAAAAAVQVIGDARAAQMDWSNTQVVELCNTALSYIGQSAKLTNLATDTSVAGLHCKRFFIEARNQLLERSCWSFATRRERLSPVTDFHDDEWQFAYGLPDNCAKVFAVLPPEAGADYKHGTTAGYVPVEFTVEQDADGYPIIYTNMEDAVARYTITTSDVRYYSSTFRNALVWLLASKLAGVVMKGAEGAAMVRTCISNAEGYLQEAETVDAAQDGDQMPEASVPWLDARN